MSVSKQKRRYSCQSWNVAAKVVLTPEIFEDEITDNEDFVTAFEDCNEIEGDDATEALQTCKEDISEETISETLVSRDHEPERNKPCQKTAKEIIKMCDKAQDQLRRSLLLENLPQNLECDRDIDKVNELIHSDNEDQIGEHKNGIDSKSWDRSKTLIVQQSTFHDQVSNSVTMKSSKKFVTCNNIQVPKWDDGCSKSITESSKTMLCPDETSKTFQAEKNPKPIEKTLMQEDISSSETLCIDESLSETCIVDIASDTSCTMLNDDSESQTCVVTDPSTVTMTANDVQGGKDQSTTIHIKEDSGDPTTMSQDDHDNDDSYSDTMLLSRDSSEGCSSGHGPSRRSHSLLFTRIKQRYEQSTCTDSITQDISSSPSKPKKVLRELSLPTQPIVKYQNIPFSSSQNSNNVRGSAKNVIKGHIEEQFKTDNDIVNGGKSIKDENVVKQTSTENNPDSLQKTSQAIYQNQDQILIIQQMTKNIKQTKHLEERICGSQSEQKQKENSQINKNDELQSQRVFENVKISNENGIKITSIVADDIKCATDHEKQTVSKSTDALKKGYSQVKKEKKKDKTVQQENEVHVYEEVNPEQSSVLVEERMHLEEIPTDHIYDEIKRAHRPSKYSYQLGISLLTIYFLLQTLFKG